MYACWDDSKARLEAGLEIRSRGFGGVIVRMMMNLRV